MSEWDYVIVGAGSAGCPLANELARSGRSRVLLLEAGGGNRSPDIKVFARVRRAGRRFGWGYVSQPDPTRAGKSEQWVRGKVLGGSSSINGTIFVRGGARDYDRWARTGNKGWAWPDVLPLFQDMESYEHAGSSGIRGAEGLLPVRRVERVHRLTTAFLAASAAAGHRVGADYNDLTQEGAALIQLSQRRGLRMSAADAFIEPLRQRHNFKLQLDSHVDRLVFDGRRAVGVNVTRNGARAEIRGRHIVLCAGTINTPKLLMLSGIGDGAELSRLGIDVVADIREVGRNLLEHPLVRLLYKSRIPSHNPTGGLLQKLRIAGRFVMHRQGPIATLFEAVAFLKSSAELPHPDIQLHFAPIGYLDQANEASPFLPFPSFTVLVNVSHPRSRGRIRLAGRDATLAPLIESELLRDPEDLETLIRGVGLVRALTSRDPLTALIAEEVMPGPRHLSPEALRSYVPARTEICYHPAGTCRMGPDATAVVNPRLEVRGCGNLWIADASIMPDLIGGNTNAASMMIGMKLGRYLASR
jgi:choline dehydrogenase